MNNKESFRLWLRVAPKPTDGLPYTKNVQNSYLSALNVVGKRFGHCLCGYNSFFEIDNIDEVEKVVLTIKSDNRYAEKRDRDFESAYKLYEMFLQNKPYTLHITYDKPLTMGELADTLHECNAKITEAVRQCAGYHSRTYEPMIASVGEGSIMVSFIIGVMSGLAANVITEALKRLFGDDDDDNDRGTGGTSGRELTYKVYNLK